MSLVTQVSYWGNGSLFLRNRHIVNARRLPIGNVVDLKYSITEDSKKLGDYESPGGGTLEKHTRVNEVSGIAKTSNYSPTNLALALRGTVATNLAATITDEPHIDVPRGTLVTLERLPDLTQPITVKVGGIAVLAAGNWEPNAAGIWIYPAATGILDGDDLEVSYSALGDSLIQALVASDDEYEMTFVGLNDARGGAPTIITAHRCQFSTTKGLDLIADDFSKMDLPFTLLSDPTIAGNSLSRFFTVRQADQAA